MGNRVSLCFKKEAKKSVVLFSQWGGMGLIRKAKKYVEELKKEKGKYGGSPLGRLEPETVLIDFIRYLTKDMKRVETDLYLGATEKDGDNSDNGHYIIRLD